MSDDARRGRPSGFPRQAIHVLSTRDERDRDRVCVTKEPGEGPVRKGRDRKGCVSSETTRVDSRQEHRGEVRERDIISRSLRKRSRSPGLQILDEARRTARFRPLVLCGPRARTPPFGESPYSLSCVRFRRESAPSHESPGTGAPPWSCSLVLWS